MDIRQLRYFEAVARHRHFTNAAAELHVAQSALSHQVRQLERERRGIHLARPHLPQHVVVIACCAAPVHADLQCVVGLARQLVVVLLDLYSSSVIRLPSQSAPLPVLPTS